jgi:hypothetical protein
MWLDKKEQSMWAYRQCLEGNDTEETRNLIVTSAAAFLYCKHIKNVEEMRNKIIDPFWVFSYCEDIKYDKKLAKIVLNNNKYPVLTNTLKKLRRK